jgi:fructose-1,6-bisphosphatase/inositol monophosphatase family enzyme
MSRLPDSARPETRDAVDAVRTALALVEGSAGDPKVTPKEGRDVVTSMDLAVEDLVRQRLQGLGLPVVGEERGGEAPADGSPTGCSTPSAARGTSLLAPVSTV